MVDPCRVSFVLQVNYNNSNNMLDPLEYQMTYDLSWLLLDGEQNLIIVKAKRSIKLVFVQAMAAHLSFLFWQYHAESLNDLQGYRREFYSIDHPFYTDPCR